MSAAAAAWSRDQLHTPPHHDEEEEVIDDDSLFSECPLGQKRASAIVVAKKLQLWNEYQIWFWEYMLKFLSKSRRQFKICVILICKVEDCITMSTGSSFYFYFTYNTKLTNTEYEEKLL